MIEIFVNTTEDAARTSIGKFKPADIPHVLFLLSEYGVIDAEGALGKVDEILYDVGFLSSISVGIYYGGK